MVLSKVNEFLPEKTVKIASNDEPWISEDVKKWNRRRLREYSQNMKSPKYQEIAKIYQKKLKEAKFKFKRKVIDDLKESNKSQWYSKLKWISNFDQQKKELITVEEINHLSDSEQAEAIADSLAAVSNEYKPLNLKDIDFSPIPEGSFPQLSKKQIHCYLENIKTKTSTVLGDIPARIIKEFAQYLSIPVHDIINQSIITGKWATIYKKEIITPIPKTFPPDSINQLRPIASLMNLNKIQERAIVEILISDMEKHLDPSQYGNMKSTSIQHYLVKLIHQILTSVDNNGGIQTNAVLCSFIDWRQAYSRQCHLLGIRSFQENGVRPALIPLLADYFKGREMRVKWRNQLSQPRKLPGGGAMGSTLGNLEYSSQTNHNADCVPSDKRFKWVDDLSILEIINLLMIGMSSHNFKYQVASDIPIHGQFIESQELKTQQYLEEINQWTIKQQMDINQQKTKAMIINFTNNYQFTTRLNLKGETIEIVDKMKILGVIITNKLDWTENTAMLVKKVNMRMQLLRAVQSFGSTREEMVHLWKIYCLSVLEQSCVVWGSSLTCEHKEDLERTQKSFAKHVLRDRYTNFESALIELNLESLEERRCKLLLSLAKSGIVKGKLHEFF